jgi:hypothetical protein
VNATKSGQIKVGALLLFFKQTLQAGERAAGLDPTQGQSSSTGRPVSEPCVECRPDGRHSTCSISSPKE